MGVKRPDLSLRNKLNIMRGTKNPNWRGGLPNCKVCGKKVSTRKTKQCKSCYIKFMRTIRGPMFGKKHTESTRKRWGEIRSGNGNHQWKGGISFEPYTIEFNQSLKNRVRERDNFICKSCKIREDELQGRFKHLAIHHIDFNPKNSNIKNLVSVCCSCHIKIHRNNEKLKR